MVYITVTPPYQSRNVSHLPSSYTNIAHTRIIQLPALQELMSPRPGTRFSGTALGIVGESLTPRSQIPDAGEFFTALA